MQKPHDPGHLATIKAYNKLYAPFTLLIIAPYALFICIISVFQLHDDVDNLL